MTHQRRSTDGRISVRENWYRDVWLLLITALAVVGIWLNHGTVTEQAKGRHFAVGATCAAISAISDEGRQVLSASANQPETRFTRQLERLGYPPLPTRRAQARRAAAAYVHNISEAIQRQVGGRGAHLVRPDGTLDCSELQRLANTTVDR